MKNLDGIGKKNGFDAARRSRNAVANPYLKQKAPVNSKQITTTTTTTSGGARLTGAAAPAVKRVNKVTATPISMRNQYDTGSPGVKGINANNNKVTPPSNKKRKQQQQQQQHFATAMNNATIRVRPATATATAASKPNKQLSKPSIDRASPPSKKRPITNAVVSSKPSTKPAATRKPAIVRKPKTLKSQLKSQIAHLNRQKLQFLQQKEAEKKRLLQQKEQERLRLIKEEELRERRRFQVSERQKRELKARRDSVSKCMNSMVQGVQRRMVLERKNGVHYAIGEVMESIIGNVEEKEKERKREEHLRPNGNHLMTAGNYAVYPSTYFQQAPNWTAAMNNAAIVHPSSHPYMMLPSPNVMNPILMHHSHNAMAYSSNNQRITSHPSNINAVVRSVLPSMMPSMMPSIRPQSTTSKTSLIKPFSTSVVATKPAKPTTKPAPLVLHPSSITDPHSPYSKSHHLIPMEISITKKLPGDSFGVVLRWECKSALVPVPVVADVASAAGSTIAVATKKQPRRKRVNYGVLSVVNANKATMDGPHSLHPGDLILKVNGKDVGGWTFAEACRAIGASAADGSVIRCVLKVARRNSMVPTNSTITQKSSSSVAKPLGTMAIAKPIVVQSPPPMIPFKVSDEKVFSGEYTTIEWSALVRGLSSVSHQLFSGMALLSTSRKQALEAIRKDDEFGSRLRQRSGEALESKLDHESKKVVIEMEHRAEQHWVSQRKLELQNSTDGPAASGPLLTDARRSALRGAARPANGCKCGSSTHQFVNDPKCPLYEDVRRYCIANSINVWNGGHDGKKRKHEVMMLRKAIKEKKKSTTKTSSSCAIASAHVDRFARLRAETDAAAEEAAFVMEMEKIQSSKMKKAVFAPSLLCTLVLSAVASMMDRDSLPEKEDGTHQVVSNDCEKFADEKSRMDVDGILSKQEKSRMDSSDDSDEDDSDSDDSDEEDVPLNSLLLQNKTKCISSLPQSKLLKHIVPATIPITANENQSISRAIPSPYFIAEILKHVSETHGHLFQEPSHADFAWQQRHRSTLASPMSKEVMFRGNPRTPGSFSFEKIRFVLNEERISRLRDAWQCPHQKITQQLLGQLNSSHQQPADRDTIERLNDEWVVTQLSSDAVTGLRHEINVLVSLGILSIQANGKLVLKQGWERRTPHIVLNEMRDSWNPEVDIHNLFCIDDRIKFSLESRWEHVEVGWRFTSSSEDSMIDDDDDDDELVFDDEEFQLREQIFTENYTDWVSEKSGMGEFGV